MFNFLKKFFQKESRFVTSSPESRKIHKILLADGKISRRDALAICGGSVKSMRIQFDILRRNGVDIVNKKSSTQKGFGHQFGGCISTYVIEASTETN